MITLIVAVVSLVLACVPLVIWLRNRGVYLPPESPDADAALPSVSVLIPARNEAGSIGDAVRSVLANQSVDFEVVVLDDHSDDGTDEVVRELARNDARVSLVSAPDLPTGWCGKQHACHCLAGHARHDLLVFMDADVRLQPDALSRMAAFMSRRNVALASGVPQQVTGSFAEKLLIPLIHFVLLCFLPMRRMRKRLHPSYGAGCGQLFVARARDYRACGGHALIKGSLHDGVKLPRAFRRAGLRTDLFDATPLASCRMYRTASEVWNGLGKNAVEGLGAPNLIVGMTALLFGGQVLPWLLLPFVEGAAFWTALTAGVISIMPRWFAVRRFRQPALGALLHPVGIVALLAIQWQALARWWLRVPSDWKGRAYGGGTISANGPEAKKLNPAGLNS